MNVINESLKHNDFLTTRLELLDAMDHEAEILDFNNMCGQCPDLLYGGPLFNSDYLLLIDETLSLQPY